MPRAIAPDDALTLSFQSLDRWLADEKDTTEIVFLRLIAESPTFYAEWRDEFQNDIRQVFAATSQREQKIRLRQLTIARCESMVLNQAYLQYDENQRLILHTEVLGTEESFEDAEALSLALSARAECTLMLARQLQEHFFGDVAPHDYFSALKETHDFYIRTIFDVSLAKQRGEDDLVRALMIAPLQQMLDRVKAEALTGSDQRYPPSQN